LVEPRAHPSTPSAAAGFGGHQRGVGREHDAGRVLELLVGLLVEKKNKDFEKEENDGRES
jgi:hypothetical protein